MRAKKLAQILNKCSNILEIYGDMEVETALEEIFSACNKTKREEGTHIKAEIPDYHIMINDDYIKMLASLNRTDLDEKLRTEDVLKSKNALLYLASQLGISSTKRQSMENLRYYILSYFERNRMDEIIKNNRVMQPSDEKTIFE